MKGVVVATLKHGLGASREGIVQELRARGASGADELAELLGVTKQCVRKHLDVLEREGYVEHAPARGDRGRPAHIFRLTPKAEELFPKRYDLLARSVLRQVGEVWGERGLNAVFCGCASEMISEFRPRLAGPGVAARGRLRGRGRAPHGRLIRSDGVELPAGRAGARVPAALRAGVSSLPGASGDGSLPRVAHRRRRVALRVQSFETERP